MGAPGSWLAMETIGLIAGNGNYPHAIVAGARRAGVRRVVVAAFENETRPDLEQAVDAFRWMRVGQLGKLISWFKSEGAAQAIMAGQIAPKNLFDLRPDLRTLMLLARLKERNAESIFGGIAEELGKDGITLLPATTFLEDQLPPPGHVYGPDLDKRQREDAAYAFRMAKETSRLDIGQSVVVRHGTVLAVEAFEGTNECIKRGGAMGRGQALLAKVSKPNQDFRFDVPVVGPQTVRACQEAGVRAIIVEARRTLVLEPDETAALCREHSISIAAMEESLEK